MCENEGHGYACAVGLNLQFSSTKWIFKLVVHSEVQDSIIKLKELIMVNKRS